MPEGPSISYADAGVSIAEADRAAAKIKKLAQRTFNRHVLTGIGSFGGPRMPSGIRLSGARS